MGRYTDRFADEGFVEGGHAGRRLRDGMGAGMGWDSILDDYTTVPVTVVCWFVIVTGDVSSSRLYPVFGCTMIYSCSSFVRTIV